MRCLALVLVLAACHHEIKQDIKVHEEDTSKTAKAAEEEVTKTKNQGAVDLDFKITRDENALVIQEADGTVEVTPVVKGKPTKLPKGAKVIGTVPLVETSKDGSKHVAPSTSLETSKIKLTETDETDKKLTGAAKLDDILDVGPDWEFYGLIAAIAAGVLAAGYVYLKFIKKAVLP